MFTSFYFNLPWKLDNLATICYKVQFVRKESNQVLQDGGTDMHTNKSFGEALPNSFDTQSSASQSESPTSAHGCPIVMPTTHMIGVLATVVARMYPVPFGTTKDCFS